MFHWSSPVLFFMGGFYRPSSTDCPPVSDLLFRTVWGLRLWVHDQRPTQTSKLGIHVGQITATWFSSSAIVHEEAPLPPTEPFPPYRLASIASTRLLRTRAPPL